MTRATIGSHARAAFALLVGLALTACPDETTDGPAACAEGQQCPCFISADCPSPLEVCIFGSCQAGSPGDTGEDVPDDTGADVVDLADASDEPDVVPDAEPDATDLADGGDADLVDTFEVSEDPDLAGGDPDLTGGDPDLIESDPDLVPDLPEPDTYADITVDVVDPTDTHPDGGASLIPWIAFVSTTGSHSQVQLVRADGRDNQVLDLGYDFTDGPSWTPDGRQLLVVTYDVGDDARALRAVNFRRGRVNEVATGLAVVGRPRVSPDGDTVVVEGRLGDGPNLIYAIDFPAGGDCATETGCSELTSSSDGDASPVWNAAGDTIFFTRHDASGGTYDVYSVAAAGGSASAVTDDGDVAGAFALDLGGTRLYYPRPSDDTVELVRYTIASGATSTFGDEGDSDPAPFSDGLRMAVVRRSFDADPEIAVIDAGNGDLIQRLTFDDVANSAPAVGSVSSGNIDVTNY